MYLQHEYKYSSPTKMREDQADDDMKRVILHMIRDGDEDDDDDDD